MTWQDDARDRTLASGASTVPLTGVLAGMSEELTRLAMLTREVEAAIFDSVQSREGAHVALSPRLHYLDFIVQSLDELAATLGRLSDAVPMADAVDVHGILHPIKLDLLRQSLLRAEGSRHRERDADRPEIELF